MSDGLFEVTEHRDFWGWLEYSSLLLLSVTVTWCQFPTIRLNLDLLLWAVEC